LLPFRIEDVLPSKSLEFFLSAQHWMDAFPPPREAHYRKLCSYLSAQLAVPRGVPATTVTRPEVAALGPPELARIEAELAVYIGPLARFLVKREAQRTPDAESLIAKLSGELESESDRATFAQRCRLLLPGAR
jgi:hypothetical protein